MRSRSPLRLLVRLLCSLLTVEPVDLDALNAYADTFEVEAEAKTA